MKKFLTILVLSFMLCGCNNKETKTIEEIMKEDNYIIVDVRTKEEYNEGHIVEALNIPYDVIENNNLDKNKIIFVYCRSGNRSNIAYNKLSNLGYDVYDLGAFNEINLPKE